ncbi:hypothetical protein IAU59_004656 [Kwoniella sp. CBS 9459]
MRSSVGQSSSRNVRSDPTGASAQTDEAVTLWSVLSKDGGDSTELLDKPPSQLDYTFRRISQPGASDLFDVVGHDSTSGSTYAWSGNEEILRKAAKNSPTLSVIASKANLANDRVRTAGGTFSTGDGFNTTKVEWWKDSVNGTNQDSCIGYTLHRPDGEVTTHGGWTDSALATYSQAGNELEGELLARSKGLPSRYSGAKGTVATEKRNYEWKEDLTHTIGTTDSERHFTIISEATPSNTDEKPGKRWRTISLAQIKSEDALTEVAANIESVLKSTASGIEIAGSDSSAPAS